MLLADLPNGARADFDHIEDILEMVGLGVAAQEEGSG